MKFGPVPLAEAVGAILAHSVQTEALVLKKGEHVTADHVRTLAGAGVRSLVVAQLDRDDIGENEAAQAVAEALAGAELSIDDAFTGRANLFARRAGVLTVDVAAVERLNAIDEALTLATLPPFRAVEAGEMVATVKVIPFAVPRTVVGTAIGAAVPLIDVRPFRPLRVGVFSTILPGLKPTTVRKTVQHLADRLAPAGATIVLDENLPHDQSALAQRLRGTAAERCDIVVVFGASAITDRRDVIPAALVEAGGTVEHFGMPVDPGNLLLLGRLGPSWFIGAPGCARSPRENGFDWVLQRLLAGLDVTADDIRRLGVGGLLMEIVSRPQPRLEKPPAATLAPVRDRAIEATVTAAPA